MTGLELSTPRTASAPAGPAAARDRLARALAARVTERGAVEERCASRALDTVLVLVLLRETGLFPDARRRMERHLLDHPADNPFDQALADRALGRPGDEAHQRVWSWLNGFEHFSGERKRVLFTTVLAAVGVPGFAMPHPSDGVEHRGLVPWVELSLRAAEVLRSSASGHRPDTEVTSLLRALAHGSRKTVWEGYVFAHALVLLAVHRHSPGHPVVAEGLAGLLTVQNEDGGMPAFDGLDVFCTATTGLALLAAGRTRRDGLLAMGDHLSGAQRPDGGWAYTEGVAQSDSDDTAYCLQLLTALSPRRYADQIAAGLSYLAGLANPDGGFPTFLRGHPSEITMTAGALTALRPHRDRHPDVVGAALGFLLDSQQPDGTYERSWSLSEANAVYRCVTALRAAAPGEGQERNRRIDHAVTAAVGRLARTQQGNGGWGQLPDRPADALSTSYALLATHPWQTSPVHQAGLAYLLTQQGADGRVVSRPDQAAPRPLPYDFPVLADAFALLALSGRDPANPAGHSPRRATR
ncbi:prenyltransferase/squalene oxidase repeat-containing protein [Saccharothrix texasensis]|uniref:Squalene-hopene/tetraprenyl-beta-curcumene cyclase n=1 Tax=Saccharothrix texasensis TaxID=103734 RepID=A0A3N1GX54_9PSEU|nr:prenyltransferase/squalene oxidase repeat-containing protein [Saccharothrix texasensis]ROP34835.1 squalene-hopene/tetraprenyl-beta-curcumene cyclase [Saccharothrix texasensis]